MSNIHVKGRPAAWTSSRSCNGLIAEDSIEKAFLHVELHDRVHHRLCATPAHDVVGLALNDPMRNGSSIDRWTGVWSAWVHRMRDKDEWLVLFQDWRVPWIRPTNPHTASPALPFQSFPPFHPLLNISQSPSLSLLYFLPHLPGFSGSVTPTSSLYVCQAVTKSFHPLSIGRRTGIMRLLTMHRLSHCGKFARVACKASRLVALDVTSG